MVCFASKNHTNLANHCLYFHQKFISFIKFTVCQLNSRALQLVDGVLTQDGDAFLYGATVIYKDLSITVTMHTLSSPQPMHVQHFLVFSIILNCYTHEPVTTSILALAWPFTSSLLSPPTPLPPRTPLWTVTLHLVWRQSLDWPEGTSSLLPSSSVVTTAPRVSLEWVKQLLSSSSPPANHMTVLMFWGGWPAPVRGQRAKFKGEHRKRIIIDRNGLYGNNRLI